MDPETVNGCRVINKARSKDGKLPWVVLCELPSPSKTEDSDRYVVWYLDPQGTTSYGFYKKIQGEARAEFEKPKA